MKIKKLLIVSLALIFGANGFAQKIDVGDGYALLVCDNGDVKAFGDNFAYRLGDSTQNDVNTPIAVLNISNVQIISAGVNHAMAIDATGTLWAWGLNTDGQIGIDSTGGAIVAPDSVFNNALHCSAGSAHSLAVKNDGSVWSWGANTKGELGLGDNVSYDLPQQVSGLTDIRMVAAGSQFSLALSSSGVVYTWGNNVFGQLGIGSSSVSDTNLPVTTVLSGIVEISAGENHALALDSLGNVWAFGKNNNYQCTASGTDVFTPEETACGKVRINADATFSYAIDTTGSVYAWGGPNITGQLGTGASGTNSVYPPVLMTTLIGDVAEIAAGNQMVLYSDKLGTSYGFGSNTEGLGDGTSTDTLTPVIVSTGCVTDVLSPYLSNIDPGCGTVVGTLTAYNGIPHPVPGLIEAEQFGEGGEGAAFHDLNPNSPGEPNLDGVDTETCSEGGDNVGAFENGEWLKYVVDVTEIGFGKIDFRIASESEGGSMRITFDNQGINDTVGFAATGGWQNWATETINNLDFTVVGSDTMTIYMTSGGFNFNYIDITITADSIDNVAESFVNLDNVYPNPFKDKVTIELAENANVSISNITGAKLFNQNMNKGSQIIDFNNQGIDESGLYFIRLN